MKSIYLHKKSGDLFAIETDDHGNVISTAGPLIFKDIDPEQLDYDDYFTSEIKIKHNDFELLSEVEYEEMLIKNGFYRQIIQKHLF